MKNSISELAENFNSKSALNFISNQTCKRAKDTAPGGVINFAPASRFKRNFKFKDATAELNFISVRNLKFYPTSAGFAARNRASVGFAVHSLIAPYSAPRVKNLERKSALNFAALVPNLNSAQILNCAENKALNSAKAPTINPCENSARNFKRNFMGNSTHSSANSESSLNRASAVDEPNLSPQKASPPLIRDAQRKILPRSLQVAAAPFIRRRALDWKILRRGILRRNLIRQRILALLEA